MKQWRQAASAGLLAVTLLTSGCQQENPQVSVYRFNDDAQWFLGQPSYENILTYDAQEHTIAIDETYGERAYLDGDALVIEASDAQAQALIEQNERLLKEAAQALADWDERYSVRYDEDYASLAICIDERYFTDIFSKESFALGGDLFGVVNIALANRILTCRDNDIGIAVTIENCATHHQVSNAYYPYQSVSVSSQDWLTSKTQDVQQPHSRQGYVQVSACIDEIDDTHILFSLQEPRTLYEEDAQLELCLSSVYADDLYLSDQLAKGDEVLLEVNGLYAIHEDGNDIADIAPISIIPVRCLPQ